MKTLDKVLIGCIMVLLCGTLAFGQVADGNYWVTWTSDMKATYVVGCLQGTYFMMDAVEAESGLHVEWLTCYRGMAASGYTIKEIVETVDYFYGLSEANKAFPVYMVILQFEFVMDYSSSGANKRRW